MAKTKSAKPLPANLGVSFKNQSGEHTATILEDRGLFWKVRDEADEEYQVKKTSCTAADLPEPVPGTLSASLAGLMNANPTPAPKAEKKAKAEKDPDLVTLADLCTELGIVGRIARRRLRKAKGLVGTGGRWEWKKSAPELAEIRTLLAAKEEADPAQNAAE